MGQRIPDRGAYQKVVNAFRRQRQGATVADIAAKTALPLNTVRELVPLAADEYSARLEVTESGEIRYSFPRGFTSKYHGFRAGLRKCTEAFKKGFRITAAAVFKVWIMGMLVGYFVLFMLIALAALMLSVAGSANSNGRSSRRDTGGGMYLASGIFNMIIRIWFYSELTRSLDRRYYGTRTAPRPKGRPLYKAIFSFVFGDGDPNADWASREKQGVIAYIQANRGVISLPEFMTLTGLAAGAAEERITSYCAEFGGMPEATEDGTVVYRFDELLLRADPQNRSFPGFSAPLKGLFAFSSNPKKMNTWFSLINGVNLIFGAYFLFNGLSAGHILTPAHFEANSYLYGVTYVLFSRLINDPLPFIILGLGFIPLAFSFLFWLIPGLRYLGTKKRNENIKLENLRKHGYRRIWETPGEIKAEDINPQAAECRPKNMAAARDRVIKEMGAHAVPEVILNEQGETVYVFTELEREKQALEKYRASIDPRSSSLGKTVFDSDGSL
jgi:Na+-transporting methylmalonyl-CoA/oxaloacetate decarboxylase gamma subunit